MERAIRYWQQFYKECKVCMLYCYFFLTYPFPVLSRVENYHQRTSQQHQTAGGGDDTDGVLLDGVCTIRPAGVHGRAQEQVRQEQGRQRNRRRMDAVSTHDNIFFYPVNQSACRLYRTLVKSINGLVNTGYYQLAVTYPLYL